MDQYYALGPMGQYPGSNPLGSSRDRSRPDTGHRQETFEEQAQARVRHREERQMYHLNQLQSLQTELSLRTYDAQAARFQLTPLYNDRLEAEASLARSGSNPKNVQAQYNNALRDYNAALNDYSRYTRESMNCLLTIYSLMALGCD